MTHCRPWHGLLIFSKEEIPVGSMLSAEDWWVGGRVWWGLFNRPSCFLRFVCVGFSCQGK